MKELRQSVLKVGLTLILLIFTGIIMAQTVDITGRVTDKNGGSLPGVTILIKGTNQGTVTNADGVYNLSRIPGDAILKFTFVGMNDAEIEVGGRARIDITLTEASIGLDEVVAIGYGNQSVRKVTTSISNVDAQKMKNASYTNIGSALNGISPGIILKQSGGGPGADVPSISIRGGGEPLYVIDGIISSKNEFVRMNPNDVSNISILKDAGATAIYGSRAANGVILVTTRKANSNSISYSNNFSWGAFANDPEMLTAFEYVQFFNKAASVAGGSMYPNEEVEKWRIGTEPGYQSTVYWEEVLKKYSFNQRHNLTIQGRDDDSNYLLSINGQDQGSHYLFDETHYQNVYSVLSNYSKHYTKLNLHFDAKLASTFRDYKTTPWDYYYTIMHAHTKLPILQPFNTQGNYMQIDGIFNPFYMQDPANGYQMVRDRNLTGTGTLRWDVPFIKNLNVQFTGNYMTNLSHNKRFQSLQPFYNSENQPIYQEKPSLNENKNNSRNYTIQSSINYKNSFNNHSVDASLIYEEYEFIVWNMGASRRNYMSESLDNLSFGSQVGISNTGTMDESARRGYIGRLMYDFKDKYFFTGSFRYDASERFRKEDRWGFFPSFSLGWRISEEKALGDLLSKAAISNLKLRLSYGEVGNDDIARFAYLSTYSVVDKRYFLGNEWLSGIYNNGLPAGEISWYTQTNYNGGLDISFLSNRLNASIDAFYYRTHGYLASPAADYLVPLGTGLPQINKGSQRRGGYEFNVGWSDKFNDFGYSAAFNFTHYESFWEENPGEDITTLKNPYTRTTYQSNYYTHGYVNNGYYQSIEDVINSPRLHGQVDLLPGDLKYIDKNGDGKIDADDRRKIGKGTFPKYNMGLNLSGNYKGLNIGLVIQGATEFDIEMWQMYKFERGASSITRKEMTDIWTPENPNALFPRANLTNGRIANYQTTDFWLLDASYVRLRNLEVGYNLSQSVLGNIDVLKSLYVYFNATNLFTYAPGLHNLYDPEDGTGNFGNYPVQKTFSFGVNIDF